MCECADGTHGEPRIFGPAKDGPAGVAKDELLEPIDGSYEEVSPNPKPNLNPNPNPNP